MNLIALLMKPFQIGNVKLTDMRFDNICDNKNFSVHIIFLYIVVVYPKDIIARISIYFNKIPEFFKNP